MKFFKRMIMLKKKKLRKLRLSTVNQNHLVNVVEEDNVKKKRLQSNVFIPDELIAEIICLLSIKTIVRLKCVSKSWNILISDPTFVQKHDKKSSQNPHIILKPYTSQYLTYLPVHCLLNNTSSTDIYQDWLNMFEVIGTYKGLLCLLSNFEDDTYSFCMWNPATRTKSGEFGTFHDHNNPYKFSFGCDISTGTYKLVAFRAKRDRENQDSWKSQVRIFSFKDCNWRNIESFSSIPIRSNLVNRNNNGVHFCGTVNWLTLSNYCYSLYYCYKDISYVEQFVIVSLDLSTETYSDLVNYADPIPHHKHLGNYR